MSSAEQETADEAIVARYRALGRNETVAAAYAGRAGGPPRGMSWDLWIEAQTARELAAEDAARAPIALSDGSQGRSAGASARRRSSNVFTVRLDDEEHAALVRRGAQVGIRPSALARSYIRAGLTGGRRGEWTVALDRLDEIAAELRGLVR